MKFCNHPQTSLFICRANQTLPVVQETEDQDEDIISKIPWIGSYFGIPEPENSKVISATDEIIMQVLLKDLTVKEYRIAYPKDVYYASTETADLLLRQLAYKDKDALAHVTYHAYTSKATGQRLIEQIAAPAMRKGPVTWQWLDRYNTGSDYTFSTAEFVKR